VETARKRTPNEAKTDEAGKGKAAGVNIIKRRFETARDLSGRPGIKESPVREKEGGVRREKNFGGKGNLSPVAVYKQGSETW